MRAVALCLIACLPLLCSAERYDPTVAGTWVVQLPSPERGSTKAVCGQAGKIRFDGGGKFKIYGLGMEGTYRLRGNKILMRPTMLMHQELGYFHDLVQNMARGNPKFQKEEKGARLDLAMAAEVKQGHRRLVVRGLFSQGQPVTLRRAGNVPMRDVLRLWDTDDQFEWAWDEVHSRGGRGVTELLDLLPKLKAPRPRASCALFLGLLKDPRAGSALIELLSDPDRRVRSSATRSLGDLKNRAAVQPIIAAFDGKRIGMYDAANALAKMGDRRATPFLVANIRDQKGQVDKYVLGALSKIGDPTCLAAIRSIPVPVEIDTRVAWMRALHRFSPTDPKPYEQVPVILAAFDQGDMLSQVAIVEALGELRDARGIPVLLKALGDDYWMPVRREAVVSLGNMGVSIARPMIERMRLDSDPQIREAVRRALAKMPPFGSRVSD